MTVRKDLLIKQLASFLEVKDPKRLTTGGLVPLVQWALPRTDRQVSFANLCFKLHISFQTFLPLFF
jgi:hypothetical protein